MKTLKEKMLEAMIERGGLGISFVEMGRSEIEGYKGDLAFGMKDNNILFWQGISSEAVQVYIEMQAANEIVFTPTSQLVYHIDGQLLNLPIAKKIMKYKSDRWMPVTMNLTNKVLSL